MKICKLYILLLFTITSVCLMMSADSFALVSNRVKNVTFDKKKNKETVIIFLEKLPEIHHFILHNPERIVVDLKNVFVPRVNINKETRGTAVKKIRIGQNRKNITRIILDMDQPLEYTFTLVRAMVNREPAIKIQIYPVHHLRVPVITNLSEQFTVREKKDPPETEEMVVLFNDTMPDDIFEKPDIHHQKPDFIISGILHMRTSFQTRKNTAIENNTSLRNRILVETKYKNMFTVSVLSDYLYFGKEDKTDEYDLDLQEARWQYIDTRFALSIGRQIIRWGKTDQISPVDTLNPQDMREFIIPDYEERKLPVWMADMSVFFDQFTLEGVFIPFFEKSGIDYFQTDWSIFRHMKKEINQSYFDHLQVHEKDPDTEAEFGVRVTTTIQNIDLGISFHHTTEDAPYFKSFPVKNISVTENFSSQSLGAALAGAVLTDENIEVEFKRTNIAGIEFETTLGNLGLRGEGAWQENESFLTSSLTSKRKPTFTYIIGADYTAMGDTYLNLQFLHRHISNYSPEILYFERNTYTLLGEISRNILSDWLEAGLKYSTNLNNKSWYLSPQLKYTYFTNLECIIGAGIFAGDYDTWLGSFKDNDLFFFNISYRFQ